ncbi:hypothetical protein HDU93_009366 [Gonapodya sp. JEL0774]|nr:hypothetical protein HDU93_009366 [Gonapodya sp. JEL0774]
MPFIFSRLEIGNVDDAQANSAQLGVLLGCYSAAQLIGSPLFGWLSDRIRNRKWPMVGGLFAGMAAIIFFAASTNFAMLVAARVLQGISAGAVWTLGLALLGDVFPDAELGKAYGIAMTGFTIGTVMGLPIGGTLYAVAGYWSPFLVSATFIVCDMIARLLVIEPKRHSLESPSTTGSSEPEESVTLKSPGSSLSVPDTSVSDSIPISIAPLPAPATDSPSPTSARFPHRIIWHVLRTDDPTYWDLMRDPAIMSLCGMSVIASVTMMSPEATVPLYLEKEFNASSVTISLMFFALVAAGLVSGPLAGGLRDKYGASRVVVPCLVCGAIVTPFWAIAKSYATFAVVSSIYGFWMTAVQAPVISEMVILVPQKAIGKVFGLFNIAFSVGGLIGPIVAGAIYQNTNFLGLCLFLTGMNALSIPLFLFFIYVRDAREKAKQSMPVKEQAKFDESLGIGNLGDPQGNSAQIGLLLGFFSAAQLISSPLLGWLSDRLANRKWPMVWGLFGGMASIVLFAASTNFVMLAIARVFQGISAAAVWTLGLSLLGDVYPDSEIGKAYGIAMSGASVDHGFQGTIIGLPIGGTLYAVAGFWSPFVVSAAFIVCDMAARLLVVEPRRRVLEASDSPKSPAFEESNNLDAQGNSSLAQEDSVIPDSTPNSRASLPALMDTSARRRQRRFPHNITWHVLLTENPTYWDLVRDPSILSLCGLVTISSAMFSSPEATVTLHLEKELNATSLTISLMFFAMIAPGLVSGPLAGILRDKYGASYVVIPCFVCTAIVAPFWAMAKSYATFALVSFTYGFWLSAAPAPLISEMVTLVPQNAIGKAFGLFNIALSFGTLVGPIVAGAIYQELGIGDLDDPQGNSTKLGLILGVYSAAQIVGAPLFGWLSDRLANRKWPMIWGLFGGMGAVILFAASANFAMLSIARFLQGISAAAVWTLGLALLGDIYPESELGRAYGIAISGFSIGTVIGIPIGGSLYEVAGYWSPFIFSAAILVCDMIGRLLVVEPKPTLMMSPEPTVTLYLQKEFGASSLTISLMFFAMVAPGLVSGPVAGSLRDKYGVSFVLMPCLVATAIATPFFAICTSYASVMSVSTNIISDVLGAAESPPKALPAPVSVPLRDPENSSSTTTVPTLSRRLPRRSSSVHPFTEQNARNLRLNLNDQREDNGHVAPPPRQVGPGEQEMLARRRILQIKREHRCLMKQNSERTPERTARQVVGTAAAVVTTPVYVVSKMGTKIIKGAAAFVSGFASLSNTEQSDSRIQCETLTWVALQNRHRRERFQQLQAEGLALPQPQQRQPTVLPTTVPPPRVDFTLTRRELPGVIHPAPGIPNRRSLGHVLARIAGVRERPFVIPDRRFL